MQRGVFSYLLYDQVVLKEFCERLTSFFALLTFFRLISRINPPVSEKRFGIFPQRAYFFGFKIAF